jgi:CO/xanthine dehydrogenase FAD-binding subunit
MKTFDYFAPQSLVEALNLLDIYGEKSKILAGGTDLIVRMKNKRDNPAVIIDIKQVPELNRLEMTSNQTLYIGAAVPLSRVINFSRVQPGFRLLYEACSMIGSLQLRNRATLGGNLCNAAPSADSAPALICLNAKIHIAQKIRTRTIPLENFFRAPGETTLSHQELVLGIEVPLPPNHSSGCYLRHTPRQDMDIAVTGVAALLLFDVSYNQCNEARIALGAVAPTPIRVSPSEAILNGKPITEALINETANKAAEVARPISDVRGSAGYRKEMVRALTRRALLQCLETRSK